MAFGHVWHRSLIANPSYPVHAIGRDIAPYPGAHAIVIDKIQEWVYSPKKMGQIGETAPYMWKYLGPACRGVVDRRYGGRLLG